MESETEKSKKNEGMYEVIENLVSGLDGGLVGFNDLLNNLSKNVRAELKKRYPKWYEEKRAEATVEQEEYPQRHWEELKKGPKLTDEDFEDYREEFLDNNFSYWGRSLLEFRDDPFLVINPRLIEIRGHLMLFLFEAVGEIPVRDGYRSYFLGGLTDLMGAGRSYEHLGMLDTAKNVYRRAYLAAENISLYDMEPILRGLLYQTMGVCKLLLEEKGAHELFQKSYDVLVREHKRIVLFHAARELQRENGVPESESTVSYPKDIPEELLDTFLEVISKGLEDLEIQDIDLGFYRIPEEWTAVFRRSLELEKEGKCQDWVDLYEHYFSIVWPNQAFFESKVQPETSLDDLIDPHQAEFYLTFERILFFLRNSEGL